MSLKEIGELIFRYVYTALVVAYVMVSLFISFLKSPRKFFEKKNRKLPKRLAKPNCGNHGVLYTERLNFHYVANGEKGKPLMLFVHGHPEIWYSWRYQLKEFGKDYYAVAYDLRGFGDSGRPPNVESYDIMELMKDVKDMIEGLGYKKCILVAHDWGGYIAWHFCHFFPEYVDKLVVANAPHPRCFLAYMQTHVSQVLKSWYIFLYHVPYLAEFFDSACDFWLYEDLIARPIRENPDTKDFLTEEDMDCYKYAGAVPGALTAGMMYYRRNVFVPPIQLKYDRITAPTLIVWGTADDSLDKELNKDVAKYVDSITIKYLEGASHWVTQQFPDETNKIIREFLKKS